MVSLNVLGSISVALDFLALLLGIDAAAGSLRHSMVAPGDTTTVSGGLN